MSMRRLFIAIALLLSGFSPALAEPSCGGVDLLARMKNADPARYEKLAVEAKATPFGAARLFRISKGSAQPSYLFGTAHVSDSRGLAWVDEIAPLLEGAVTLAIENNDLNPKAPNPGALMKFAAMMVAKPDELLEQTLGADELQTLAKAAAPKLSLSPEATVRLRPWPLIMALGSPLCESLRAKTSNVVDYEIAARAQAKGLPVVGLETVDETLESIMAPSRDTQIDILRSSLASYGEIESVFETVIRLLDRGETGLLAAYARDEGLRTLRDPRNWDIFMSSFVDDRNRTMFRVALPLVERGGAFIAVGALHLPGEKGLVKMFADAGYRIEPIILPRTTKDE
ncbi:TraB/GumN family protein [Terrarubrum flagellatum]|uniref:TraB/GumN family protein n=1 Tax=Terrirubrum flagellatum TaxID=2895980 RepID=UPI003144D3CA